MSYPDRFTRTVTVLATSPSTPDEYGTPTYTETSTDVLGHYRQLSADELGENVELVAFRVYLPTSAQVDAGDRLTLGAISVEVVGQPTELYDARTGLVVGKALRAEVAQ